MPRAWWAVGGCAALLLATMAVAGTVEASQDAWIAGLLRDAQPTEPMTSIGDSLAPGATAGEHLDALKRDRLHGNVYTVDGMHGPRDARRVVFLVSQYHRSPLLPVTWCSVGEAIAQVQVSIGWLVVHLARHHGLSCIGTEGSSTATWRRTPELDQAADWVRRLDQNLVDASRETASWDPGVHVAMQQVRDALAPYLRRHAQMMDGVGMAAAYLARDGPSLNRFGVEDAALNQKALEVLARLRAMEEELASLEPASTTETWDLLGALWLDEYPAFQQGPGHSLRTGFAVLDRARIALRAQDESGAAERVDRFTSLARLVTEQVLDLDGIESYRDYYAGLESRIAVDGGASGMTPSVPRRGAASRLRQLRRQHARAAELYERLAHAEREQVAAKKILDRLLRGVPGQCALVMGANHRQGLVKALLQQGGGSVALLELAPVQTGEPQDGDGGFVRPAP